MAKLHRSVVQIIQKSRSTSQCSGGLKSKRGRGHLGFSDGWGTAGECGPKGIFLTQYNRANKQ